MAAGRWSYCAGRSCTYSGTPNADASSRTTASMSARAIASSNGSPRPSSSATAAAPCLETRETEEDEALASEEEERPRRPPPRRPPPPIVPADLRLISLVLPLGLIHSWWSRWPKRLAVTCETICGGGVNACAATPCGWSRWPKRFDELGA